MSIMSARKFIMRSMADGEFRSRLNKTNNAAERDAVLEEEGFTFNFGEFLEAQRNLMSDCQFKEDADHFNELKMWWEFVIHTEIVV